MNIFKDYKYTWWQMAIFKVALLSAGVLIGSYWSEFFSDFWMVFVALWLVSAGYVMYISFKK